MLSKEVWSHLNFAPPGGGKSYFGWSASKAGQRVYHIDLLNEADVPKYPKGSTLVRLIEECGGDQDQAFNLFASYVTQMRQAVADKKFPYDLVIVDSIDTLQLYGNAPSIADEKERARDSSKIDDEILSPAGYGRLYLKVVGQLIGVLSLGVSLYVTSLPGFLPDPSKPKLRDPKTGDMVYTQIRPALVGKLGQTVEKFFSLVTYQVHDPVGGKEHRMYLEEGGEIPGIKVKNRYNAKLIEAGADPLPAYVDCPTWGELVVPTLKALNKEKN